MVSYVAYLSAAGLSHATARSYLSAISYKCKIMGYPDPTQNFLTVKLLLGMKHLKQRTDTRLPITLQLLERLVGVLPVVCESEYESKLFAAAYTLAFFGFLRVGEFTLSPGSDRESIISMNDAAIVQANSNGCIQLTIRRSKTDQLGSGVVLSIPKVGGIVCPVHNLIEFLAIRPKFQGPLYCHFGGKCLTRYQFTSVLKKALCCIGLPSGRYNSHSFRIGAATAAAIAGHREEVIQQAGRWRSGAFKSYIRIPPLIS